MEILKVTDPVFKSYGRVINNIDFSELIEELKIHLDMMKYQPLSPGLKSALRQTKERIDKLNTV